MTISEYYDNWYNWRNTDIKDLNVTMDEYIILDNYMEYVYNLIVELISTGYIKNENIENIVPDMIKLEFKKINTK